MRCPKCGYISFDNVDKCLKCKKNIADQSSEFSGSVLNVATPVFLNLTADEEDVETGEFTLGDAGETGDEDHDIVDPDLDILMNEEEGGDDGEIEFDLDDAALEESESGVDSDLDDMPDLDGLSDELSEIEAFSEDDDEDESADDDVAIDLGALEEAAEEAPTDELPAMEMPDELADLSDLSPPAKAGLQPEEPGKPELEMEPEMELGTGLDLSGIGDLVEQEPAPPEIKKEETVLSLDMDEDLNFELDLGGLSIHDDK